MKSAERSRRSMPLDEYDPWPTRLVIIFLGAIGLAAVVAVIVLKLDGVIVEGVIAIPVAVVTALPMVLSRRPPWTARSGPSADSQETTNT